MSFNLSPKYLIQYFLKKESTQFFTSVAIRYFALGMVGIYEPIYIYLYFGKSISSTLLFFAAFSGLFALLVVWGGRIMAKIGLKRAMLISSFFYFAYYICLFFLDQHFLLLPLAILMRAIGAVLFWPAFHTDFIRWSKRGRRAVAVGKISVISLVANVISPLVGGLILVAFGYLVLFVVVLLTLFTSVFPLFLSKERREVYTDCHRKAWQRIFRNKDVSLSLACLGIEAGVSNYLWPIFLFILGINYDKMGGIATMSLAIAALFALYMGRAASSKDRPRLLNIGSIFLSAAWVIKYFVVSAFSAFLAESIYRIAKTAVLIPFRTILYNKAADKKAEADEFIIYREIILNISRFFFLVLLAGVFLIYPKLNMSFIIAAAAAIGFSFLLKPRLFSLSKKRKI